MPPVSLGRSIRPTAILLLAFGAPALTGCGSDEQRVEKTLTTYLTAVVEADGPTACAQLAPAARDDLVSSVAGARDCEDAVRRYRSGLTAQQREELRTARVTEVSIEGDRATARVAGAESGSLEQVEGEWRISARSPAGR